MARLDVGALDGLDGAEEEVGLGDAVGAEHQGERGSDEQHDQGGCPDGSGFGSDLFGDPVPEAVRRGLGARLGEVGSDGPECGSAEERENRGQEGHRRQERGHDADRGNRAEAAIGVEVGEQQAQHSEDHRAGRRRDRLDRRSPRNLDRLILVCCLSQLLTEARHQEECVVGCGAEHEDEQNALALTVELENALLGQEVDGTGREPEREDRRDDDDKREDGTAVDDDENDDHHRARNE